jgi:CelD/BcsL family acetyltransferase involved in cellulose biosynthesis
MGERVEWITESNRLVDLSADWDLLADGPLQPFLSSSWFKCWWEAFGHGHGLRICALWRDHRLVAVFPLRSGGGRRLAAISNDHSPIFRPLAADERALETVVEAALDSSWQVDVESIPAEDPALRALERTARRRRRLLAIETLPASPTVATGGDFGRYREPRKHRWREIERRGRKLRREHETEFRLVTEPRELKRELETGLQLEASGWKGKAGTAILASTSTAGFYRSLARLFHSRGELRLSSLVSDDEVIAFDLALVHGSRYFLLKTAYDERYRSLAPGLVMRLAVIERCFELGLEAHEFLGPDMEWKRLFATGAREQRAFRAYSVRPLALARFAYRRGARPLLRRGYRFVRSARRGRP